MILQMINMFYFYVQREFVNNCGYDLLMELINLKDDYKMIVQWLMTDIDNLRLYIHGGNPAGDNYFAFLDVLMNLYKEYGSDLENNIVLQSGTRYGDNGCQLHGNSVALTFTEDQVDEEHKYISISRLSIESYYPTTFYNSKYTSYAIDGSIYSIWHFASDATSNEKYVVLKLDQPTYISALKYYPNLGSANGRILNAKSLISEDGQDWTEVVESTS